MTRPRAAAVLAGPAVDAALLVFAPPVLSGRATLPRSTVDRPDYEPSRSLGGLQIMDLAVLLEVLHTMELVATCSPHHTRAGHVSDSRTT